MSQSLNTIIQTLDESISKLESKVDRTVDLMKADQTELFGISQEEKTLNKTIASKLDSTIERLETLLTEG